MKAIKEIWCCNFNTCYRIRHSDIEMVFLWCDLSNADKALKCLKTFARIGHKHDRIFL